jgi:hypothetical protein
MISFLMVLIRVTNKDFSITSLHPNFYSVPILNKRMYVSIKPAIIFESDPAEPKVKRNPKKTETPLKWANRFLGDKEKSRLT